MSRPCYYEMSIRRDSEINAIADTLLIELRQHGKMTKPELFRQALRVVYELAKADGGRVIARVKNGRILLHLEP